MMKEIYGKTAQKGFAAGKAFVIGRNIDLKYQQGDIEEENTRLDSAMGVLEKKLDQQINGDKADMIRAEIMILKEDDYTGYAHRLINDERLSAVDAIKAAEKSLCTKLESSGNEYIKERCSDIRGMTKNLIDIMSGNDVKHPVTPCIIVAEELSPSDISLIDPGMILGILTETGSPTSHVSVLAGSFGVPYLYGINGILENIKHDDFVILDSDNGMVTVDPPAEKAEEALARQADILKKKKESNDKDDAISTKMRIYANIGGINELQSLVSSGADGVGLVRSEFLFTGRKDEPSEDEQFEAYKSIVSAMNGKEVVIRTMDIGSDKQAEWLPLPEEANPALGLRGLRVSLEHRELFRKQLKALMRSAVFGNLKIMIPMVASEWEIDAVAEEIKIAASELESEKIPCRIPELGVMIETPAAVMIAPRLASKVRFFSIGTNDLTQYTLALDRESRGLDRYYDPLHEAVFKMIEMTVNAAHKSDITVAICGELAGNPDATERLIGLGVDELSVSIGKFPGIRRKVAEIEEKEASRKLEFEDIKAPADGELIPMDEIPDEVFSSGMMGECLGIMPKDGIVYAPVNGVVTTVAKTRHAISFKNESVEILVHVGIDTVKMNGEGFTVKVEEGQSVKQGQPVLEFDISKIRNKGFNPMVIIAKN